MSFKIINNKKLNWSHTQKVMVDISGDTFNYKAALSIQEIARIHFLTGNLLNDYYVEE